MVYRNNAGRLGAGFINVFLETRWLGYFSGFYVGSKHLLSKKNPARAGWPRRLSLKRVTLRADVDVIGVQQ